MRRGLLRIRMTSSRLAKRRRSSKRTAHTPRELVGAIPTSTLRTESDLSGSLLRQRPAGSNAAVEEPGPVLVHDDDVAIPRPTNLAHTTILRPPSFSSVVCLAALRRRVVA